MTRGHGGRGRSARRPAMRPRGAGGERGRTTYGARRQSMPVAGVSWRGRMRSSLRLLMAVGAIILGLASGADAQGLTGQLSGSVVDASESVLPGATVTVVNT